MMKRILSIILRYVALVALIWMNTSIILIPLHYQNTYPEEKMTSPQE